MVMSQNTLDLDLLVMASRVTDALKRFRFYRNGSLLQQLAKSVRLNRR
jgi:hypothetical protein